MTDKTNLRICDTCNNLYVTMDGTRERCLIFPESEYVRSRMAGESNFCSHYELIKTKEQGELF